MDTFERSFESFQVSWDAVLLSDLPVYGYVLMMDDGLLSDLSVIYDGSTNPQTTTYQVLGLVAGRTYNLRVHAIDVNGAGEYSDVVSQIACVKP